MVGVAVKVTEPPVQIEVLVAFMLTVGTTVVAVTGMALLVAVVGVAQGSSEVRITVTTSPSASVVVAKVEPVSPVTSVPLICH